MLSLIAAAALAVCALQDPPTPAPAPAPQPQDEVDREMRRLKQRLGLSDDQEAKVREILKSEAEQRKASRDKLRELLTDEQKAKLDQAGGMRGGSRDMDAAREAMNRSSSTGKQLQKDLGLTDEQATRIDEIAREHQASVGPMRIVMGEGGAMPDMDEINKKQQESHKALGEKIKATVTDEQKGKFDEVWAKRSPSGTTLRMPAGAFSAEGFKAMAQQAVGASADPTRQPPAERAKRVLEALKIEKADEAAAVRTLVDQICAAQKELADHTDRMGKRVRDLARDSGISDDAVAKELETLREERRAIEKRVVTGQTSLREVVTYKQELTLIEHGVLR